MTSRARRRIARAAISFAAAGCAVSIAEAVCREVDGYRITSAVLERVREPRHRVRDRMPDLPYATQVPRAPSVSLGWYTERPQEIPRIPLTPALQQRAAAYPTEPWSPFFEWNVTYLKQQACRDTRDVALGTLRDFYYFDSLDGSVYPTYRHLRHVSPPHWFVTNNFGWRGRDVVPNKPADTIRIAFVGASTTVDAFEVPFSHPELIDHWLNRWAAAKALPYRFEVINAGRMGITSNSIAAIVTQELLPVSPDLVVYYEGANQFWPNHVVTVENGKHDEPAKPTFRRRLAAEDYSALARRLLTLSDRMSGGGGYEPRKPPSKIVWPATVNESDPALDHPSLPMDLPNIVACLEIIRNALASIHAELVVSSFVWIVHDGMRLDLGRDLNLYNYLNRTYWPFTYAEMRRLVDFQNRVFAKYARMHHVPFIDMAAEFPQDPALGADAIHFTYPGLVLQAWMFLQHLVPMIEERLADGRFPHRADVPYAVHPAFAQPSRRSITLDELRAECH